MRPTVLIVDDSEILIAWLRMHLEAVGYSVLSTSNPSEAGSIVARTRPSAVIVDVIMPQRDCGEVLANIRMHDPERSIPIILHSGQPPRRLHEAAVRYGATGYVQKKRDVAELLGVLDRCVSAGPSAIVASTAAEAAKKITRCLFVDDDASVLRSYQRFFSNKIDADYVTSAVDALGRLHAVHPPGFVVSDLVMPHMSGFDLYARAVSLDEAWRGRFVFVTGSDAWRDEPTTRVPVLPKPVSVERLRAFIEGRG